MDDVEFLLHGDFGRDFGKLNDLQRQVPGIEVFLVFEKLEIRLMGSGEGDAPFLGELDHAGLPFHRGVGVQFNGSVLHHGETFIGILAVHLLHFPVGDIVETRELKSVSVDGRIGLGNNHP